MATIFMSGPQGPQGAQGPQGPAGSGEGGGGGGAQGYQGAQGSQGQQGPQGPAGSGSGGSGAQGAQGATGATGAQGSQGATGAQGSQGATGAQGSIFYDVSGEYSGTPSPSVKVLNFVSARSWTLSSSGTEARCLIAPSGTTVFDVQKNGSSIGSITYSVAGGTTASVSVSTTSFSSGDILTIIAPSSLNGISTLYWTFAGTSP